ncbi:hypothetical protein [Bacillus sp. XF8]|uniref:hypothetical protein n=1 Tax=Bacillus sp. XF8 TaxID=2819289 RepID=UPI001AA0A1E7|nr:hypothetical protein [Bacillus sp. XF8]MBO1583294.1 hypothetical protein [Bacillus sp. XF8]
MKTKMSRREQLAYVVGIIDNGGRLEKAIDFAKSYGIVTRMHEGEDKKFFEDDDHVAEWLMGQFIYGFEEHKYLGYNTGINIAMSFLGYRFGYREGTK